MGSVFLSFSCGNLCLYSANLLFCTLLNFLIGLVVCILNLSIGSYSEISQFCVLIYKSLSIGNCLSGCIVCTKRSGGVSGVCLDKTINLSHSCLIFGAGFVVYGSLGIKMILGISDDSLTFGVNSVVRFCEIVRSLVIAIVRQFVGSFLCSLKSRILIFQSLNDTCVSIVVGDDWLCFLI